MVLMFQWNKNGFKVGIQQKMVPTRLSFKTMKVDVVEQEPASKHNAIQFAMLKIKSRRYKSCSVDFRYQVE